MKKFLIVLGVVVAVIIAVVIVAFVAKDKFRPDAEKVLADLNAGKEAEVYAGASTPFKRDVPLQKFRDYVESRRRALGEFKRVVECTGGGISASTDSGTIGSVSLELEYEKGPAEGEFRFLKEDGAYRLLEMKVTWSSPDRAALEGRCQELLALYGASSFTALYAKFSAPLREAWKAEAYEPQIRELFAKAGKTTSATRRDTKDAGDEKVQVTFDVQFEQGPGEATFGWDGSGAGWELVAFDLHLGKR